MLTEWYSGLSGKIEELKQKLFPRDVKEYQLDKLLGLARRIDEFAACDPVCQKYQKEIESMVNELYQAPLPQARNKVYIWTIGEMVSHLKKQHCMVNEGEYLGWWLIFGLIAGGIVGLIIGNSPPATLAGLFLGAVIGLILDYRAKKQGRVI